MSCWWVREEVVSNGSLAQSDGLCRDLEVDAGNRWPACALSLVDQGALSPRRQVEMVVVRLDECQAAGA